MEGIALCGPTLRPPKLIEHAEAAAVAETRSAGRRAALAIRAIDAALPRTRCAYCQSGLYGVPRLCPACSRIRIERRSDERPLGPIEHSGHAGRVLSVR